MIEQQVTNLELSKKLKELGVKQKSLFYWIQGSDNKWGLNKHIWEDVSPKNFLNPVSAFLASELGEILPETVRLEAGLGMLVIFKSGWNKKWKATYQGVAMDEQNIIGFTADTEADARAKMLIHLLENKLITL